MMEALHESIIGAKRVMIGLLSVWILVGFVACWGGDVPNDIEDTDSTQSAPPTLSIATTSLPLATEGQAYLTTLSGVGGTTPYTWLVTPSLPNGLTLDAATGDINGAPATGTFGTSNYDFELQDDALHSVTKRLALIVSAAGLTITTTSLPTGTVNQKYPPTTLSVTGGVQPYVWSVNPALPNGLALNALAPGMISGIPLDGSAGTTSHAFTVTDSAGPTRQTNSKTLSLTINLTVPPLIITTGSVLARGNVGDPYTVTLQASGGTLPLSWSADRALPPGLTLNVSTGEITGTPTVTSNVSFNATVRDSSQPTNLTSSKLFNLQVTN